MTPAPSDGAALLRSALIDERVGGSWSPVDWIHVTFLFPERLGMTKDPAFSDNVLDLLLEHPHWPVVSKVGASS